MNKPILFWLGILFILILAVSFPIKITSDQGTNFLTKDRLLGIIIFHNPFILAIYILIAITLIKKGTTS